MSDYFLDFLEFLEFLEKLLCPIFTLVGERVPDFGIYGFMVITMLFQNPLFTTTPLITDVRYIF